MTVRVGLVGAGVMGAAHARTLTEHVPGVRVTRVYDCDRARASEVAARSGAGLSASAADLIADEAVDAVVIASPDDTHPDLALACIGAGKPTLCEKPLAPSSRGARRVVDAEVRSGRTLVQVGFMRRYDVGYRALKQVIASGDIGEPLVVHCIHRNSASATSATDEAIVTGSMIHELDVVPWPLGARIQAVRIESPRSAGLRDPQLAWLYLTSGAMATVEVFVNARYGYDVACQVVGTEGAAELTASPEVWTRMRGRRSRAIHQDFTTRFADAYRRQMADWVARLGQIDADHASAWDGYRASLVAEAGVVSLTSGDRQDVAVSEPPSLYRRQRTGATERLEEASRAAATPW